MTQLHYVVEDKKGRIDKVLKEAYPDYSRSQIQSWLKEEAVKVNGDIVKANYKVKHHDEITIDVPKPKELTLEPQDIPIEIVYEDNDVIVVNKPQGMVVHPSMGHPNGTLVNALLYYADSLSSINDVIRPGIVHRIDKDTSGLLMVAKNDAAHIALQDELRERKTLRKYVALVHGVIPHEKGKIDAPIGRSKDNRQKQAIIADGKEAVTHFTVLKRFLDYTLIECVLETGRTHQIRVHMDYIGYPIVGDPLYGPKKTIKGNGQFLHAKTLAFTHPTTGELMTFDSELPKIFKKTLKEIENND